MAALQASGLVGEQRGCQSVEGLGQQALTPPGRVRSDQDVPSRVVAHRYGPQGGWRAATTDPRKRLCQLEQWLRSQCRRALVAVKAVAINSLPAEPAAGRWKHAPAIRSARPSAHSDRTIPPQPVRNGQFVTRALDAAPRASNSALQQLRQRSASRAGNALWRRSAAQRWGSIHTAAGGTRVAERSAQLNRDVSTLTPRRKHGLLQGLLQPEQGAPARAQAVIARGSGGEDDASDIRPQRSASGFHMADACSNFSASPCLPPGSSSWVPAVRRPGLPGGSPLDRRNRPGLRITYLPPAPTAHPPEETRGTEER